jgi:hypothetical protein
MPTRAIGELLTATEELKALSARTRRLRDLQTLYFRSAPRELAGSSRVKNYRAGTLYVAADNPAVAAKLKQLAPTVLASIRKTEAEVTGLRIEVQVSDARSERSERRKAKALSLDAVEKFDELANRVADGNLRVALQGLVRRHKREGSV